MKTFDRLAKPAMVAAGTIHPMILIYQDYVHNNGALYKALAHGFGHDKIRFFDIYDIKNNILNNNIKALVMPGGATRYINSKLSGYGNQKIKEYVAQGGTYIGICAGAYYACEHTEWHPVTGPSIVVKNELGFFQGVAKGPIHEICPATPKGSTAAITRLALPDGQEIRGFYWGGPSLHSSAPDSYDVLARYVDLPGQPEAVIAGSHGKGRYLLFSPHLEIDTNQLDLMTFDVIDNRYADIAALPDRSGVNNGFFLETLSRFID